MPARINWHFHTRKAIFREEFLTILQVRISRRRCHRNNAFESYGLASDFDLNSHRRDPANWYNTSLWLIRLRDHIFG